MKRIPEEELMLDPLQVAAYSEAAFAEMHDAHVERLREKLAGRSPKYILDIACGPGDVTCRMARAFPESYVVGVDASAPMLALARQRAAALDLDRWVRFEEGYFPGACLDAWNFDVLVCTGSFHHFAEPLGFWGALHAHGKPGADVYVVDLCRPVSMEAAREIVAAYAAAEAPLLKRDFEASLCASYRVPEIREQLRTVELSLCVEALGELHWHAWGRLA